jgi:Ion transport protein
MPRMFAVGGLLGIVSYIFAVMFTEMFKDLNLQVNGYTEYDYWNTLQSSFFTLFQIMTLDNWAQICREMIVSTSWSWIPIVIYLVVASFIITNLIIAIVCDAVAVLRDNEKAKIYGTTPSDTEIQQQDKQRQVPNRTGQQIQYQEQQQSNNNVLVLQKQIELLEQHVNSLTQIQNDSVGAVQKLVSNHPELITST